MENTFSSVVNPQDLYQDLPKCPSCNNEMIRIRHLVMDEARYKCQSCGRTIRKNTRFRKPKESNKMFYFTVFEQSKHAKIRTHEGTSDSRGQTLSVSKQLTIMYQYSIYQEGVNWQWLSESMTEEQFNTAFDKGQRLFFLETHDSRFIVKIEDYEELKESYKEMEQVKVNAVLFDDLQVYCSNFVDGFFTFDEFKRLIKVYKEFDRDKNKEVFDLKISQIENEIDLRGHYL